MRRFAIASAGSALLAAGLALAPLTTAAPASAVSAVSAPAVAIGAEGGNGQLYVQAPQLASGWQSLGGQITGAPAVAALPNATATTPADALFIAAGSNGELWMRSLTLGWQPVGPSEAFCIGSPAALITGSTLTVACEGQNRQLYYNTTTLPSSGLPAFTSAWTSLGGVLSAGPAVAPVGGTVTFFAEGTNGEVFTNTGAGFTATAWFCIGTLAAATDASTGITTFGCQGQGDHSLWQATNSGSGWSAAQSAGGQLLGGSGIAAAGGMTEFYAEGTDGSVWEWTAATGWASLGGVVIGGIGAAALSSTPTAPEGSSQLITVTASYGSTTATLTAYDLTSSGWVTQFGPWTAEVGYNGVAAPGTKMEGDGKTPSGTYGFSFMFGVLANPGVLFPYQNVFSYDYWDDDPTSPLYNEWVDAQTANPGANPEPMDNVPAYNYGAVIAYNTARTPGLGSAIFLHVDTGGSTAGCVSLPQADLLEVLTWLNPVDNPVIEITGV